MKTVENIQRKIITVDAENKPLGRLAVEVAVLLRGKNKPDFITYLDMGDFVEVINAAKVKVTGKKFKDKIYTSHSGYPGGLKQETFDKMIIRKPEYIIEHAVKGMLPHNRLGRAMIKKLKVFKGAKI